MLNFGGMMMAGMAGEPDPFYASVTALIQPTASDATYTTDAKGNSITYNGNAALFPAGAAFAGGNAIAFDGSGDFVQIDKNILLNLNGVTNYTIEALFTITGGSTADRDIFGLNVGGRADSVSLKSNGSGRLGIGDWGGGNFPNLSDASSLTTGELVYAAFVKSGSNGTLYRSLNGAAVSSVATTASQPGSPWADVGVPASIFGRTSGGTDLQGRLFALRVTNGVARTVVTPTTLWPTF